jgi:glycopeptide antibiotics resistance protein
MEYRTVNLIPFHELFLSEGNIDLPEIIMNVLIFIPLGIYAGVLFKRWTFWIKLFFCCLISVTVELLQFILKAGAFDMTDIINNTLGGLIGLITFQIIARMFNNTVRSQNFINIFAATGTVIMITLLVLLKLNMLPIRYQ